MSRNPRNFLVAFAATSIALAGTAIAFNVTMDPYLVFDMPRIAGVNARKPAVNTHQHLMKANDVLRATPSTLLLGGSRIGLGVDARHPAWRSGPVYNLAFPGGRPYVAYRYLQHAMSARQHPTLVVLGLDFESFLVDIHRFKQQDFESRLAITRQGTPNHEQERQRARDAIQAAFSLESLIDSGATLAANVRGTPVDLVAGNWDVGSYHWAVGDIRTIRGWISYASTTTSDLGTIRYHANSRANPLVIADVRATLDLCRSNGIDVTLFINPVHADNLEVLSLLGYWPDFEDWKRQLVDLAAEYSSAHDNGTIPLWDFTDYDEYSTEEVALGQTLRWFFESVHYNRALGDMLVRRINGSGDVRFGMRIDSRNIEAHLAGIRERQQAYREREPQAVHRIRYLYDSALIVPPSTAEAR